MKHLTQKKFRLALPVVYQKASPMIFRSWKPGDQLVKSSFFNNLEPDESQPVVKPDILLVPLLAFREDCHRLGYGGGYYDRTIH